MRKEVVKKTKFVESWGYLANVVDEEPGEKCPVAKINLLVQIGEEI